MSAPRRRKGARDAACAVVACAAMLALALVISAQERVAIGLDHIPVAVHDLEGARAMYARLGFALKAGRPHANGLRNAHVKFPDGAGIELLTVSAGVDAQTRHYLRHLRDGDGPAFVSLHARDTSRLHAALKAGDVGFRQDGEITTLLAPEFSFLFFVRDNRSPTDRPEHFAHANGATALAAVWIATEHEAALVRLLARLGGRPERRSVAAPEQLEATVVTLGTGEVVILPKRHQLRPDRPIVGASFSVRHRPAGPVVAPRDAFGLWLHFREGF